MILLNILSHCIFATILDKILAIGYCFIMEGCKMNGIGEVNITRFKQII